MIGCRGIEDPVGQGNGPVRPHVFIQANAKQSIGAVVSAYSLKRVAADPDSFDVTILYQEDHPLFSAQEGQRYRRHGVMRVWRNDDLQSFTLLRFMPPQLMGYRGRALVIDPDVFAVSDIGELLGRDMAGKAILCRRSKFKNGAFATSVMLLDCARLAHWDVERGVSELFQLQRDYHDWVSLRLEPPETIGAFEDEWNDFDRLTPKTRMLHNTRRRTQPWKTGLPVRLYADRVRSGDRLADAHAPGAVRRSRPARPLCPPPRPQPGGPVLRPAARMPGSEHRRRGEAARRDGAKPHPPRCPRGHRPRAEAGGRSRRGLRPPPARAVRQDFIAVSSICKGNRQCSAGDGDQR
jgi:hypothetical protein